MEGLLWLKVKVTWSCLTLCNPMDCSPPGSFVHRDSPGKNTGVGLPCPPPGDLPNPGIEPRSAELQENSLLSEPPGNPQNTGVGSLPLLQGNFLTQESNQGLLHCRWILYHLSYQGSHCSHSYEKSVWNLTLNSNSQNPHLYIIGSLFRGEGKIAGWEKMKFN